MRASVDDKHPQEGGARVLKTTGFYVVFSATFREAESAEYGEKDAERAVAGDT